MKQLFIVIFCLVALPGISQLTYEYDTLRLHNRIHGDLDSIDYKSGFLPASVDGGKTIFSQQGLSVNRLIDNYTAFGHQGFAPYRPMKFSALPYIGFSYSFGSKGAQFISGRYYHVFKDSLILNVEYDRSIATGYVRNTSFRRNNVNLQLERKGRRYSFQLMGMYLNDSLFHAGGVVWDTTTADNINNLGLEFISVNKAAASSNSQRGHAGLNNFINITRDSIRQLGLTTKHSYRLMNRRYLETDSLHLIYPEVNIDTFQTRDKHNLASISNAAGFFLFKKGFHIDALVEHTYWKFRNLGNDADTTEIDLRSDIVWRRKNIGIRNAFKFNLIGGFNAWTNRTSIDYRFKDFKVNGYVNLLNTAPEPIKRSYLSNNFAYDVSDIRLQNMLQAGGEIGTAFSNDKYKVSAFANYAGLSNIYLFDDTTWVRSGSANMLEVGLSSAMKFGKFYVQPRLITAVQSEQYLPAIQGYLRVYLKTKVFKAKKMELVIGLDGSYISAFNYRTYTPAMDVYNWFATPGQTKAMANAHFFFSFSISTFRFFARYENIGYFWNDRTSFEQHNYPIAGTRIRVGISWDFFN